MRTCTKAWMSSNFGQIPLLYTNLAALEHLKIDVATFSPLLLIRSIFKLDVTGTCIVPRTSSNFYQIGLQTSDISALECLKIPQKTYNGENGVSTFFLVVFDPIRMILTGRNHDMH